MTSEEKAKVRSLHASGLGYKAISGLTGIPESTIGSFCRKHKDDRFCPCEQCGADVLQNPGRKKKRFCSDICRMLWWNSHREQVNHSTYHRLVCRQCGKHFISYDKNDRKFCSMDCYANYRRKHE